MKNVSFSKDVEVFYLIKWASKKEMSVMISMIINRSKDKLL